MLIAQFFEAEDNARREEEHKEMKIHEEGRPCGRLVFGYGSDNWYIPKERYKEHTTTRLGSPTF
jgi:hypothetical protein